MVVNAEKAGLLVLRTGLAVFLGVWGIDKLLDPEGTIRIFEHFYLTSIGEGAAYVLGTIEIVIALAMLLGLFKTFSYGAGLAIHAVSTLSSVPQMLPWSESYDHLFVAGIPVLCAFVALWLMRDKDTFWVVKF